MSATIEVLEHQSLAISDASLPLSADRKASFFNALISTGGHLGKACQLANVSRQRVLQWRNEDAVFAEAYDDALEFGTENLEERLYARGMDTDTTAAIFLLKARRPEKYRENINLQGEMTLNPDELVRTFALAFERLRAQRLAEQAALNPAPDPPTE